MARVWTDTECAPFNTPWRQAQVLRVVDGDTFDMRVAVGFGVNGPEVRVRLLGEGAFTTPLDPKDDGVDAWETKGVEKEKGLAAKARAIELMPADGIVRIFSQRGGRVDGMHRWLAAVLVPALPSGWISLGDMLLEEGHAVPWVRS